MRALGRGIGLVAAAALPACARGTVVSAPPTQPSTSAVATELSTRDVADIEATLRNTADFDAPFAERLPYLADSDDLGPAADQAAELARSFSAEVDVVAVEAGAAPGTAIAKIDVTVGDATLLDDGSVPLTHDGNRWKVTRVGVCTIIALVIPCPDPPS